MIYANQTHPNALWTSMHNSAGIILIGLSNQVIKVSKHLKLAGPRPYLTNLEFLKIRFYKSGIKLQIPMIPTGEPEKTGNILHQSESVVLHRHI